MGSGLGLGLGLGVGVRVRVRVRVKGHHEHLDRLGDVLGRAATGGDRRYEVGGGGWW